MATFTPGRGKLVTDRYDFQDHVDGYAFKHHAAGYDGYLQFRGTDTYFDGTFKLLVNTSTGEITHTGSPIHKETPRFQDSTSGVTWGEALSQWNAARTTNTTPATIQTISLPIATYGDCLITIIWEVTVAASSGGGNMCRKTVLRRNSGTLSIVNNTDNSVPEDLTIATSLTVVTTANENILLRGTGISGNVNWITSAHVQIARVT